MRIETSNKYSFSILRSTSFTKMNAAKKTGKSAASSTLGTKHTQLRHANLVTSLKSPVANSLTSRLWEFLARLDEGSGLVNASRQQVDPRAVSAVTAVSRSGSTDANFEYISRVPFHGCCLCSLERRSANFLFNRGCLALKLCIGRIQIESWDRDAFNGIVTRLQTE